MKRIRLFVRAFFGFSRMETNGFLLLMPLMLVILFSQRIYRYVVEPQPLTGLERTDSLVAWLTAQKHSAKATLVNAPAFHRFDPNKATHSDLTNLGLDSSIADRIVRYRQKGGQFRKTEDVARIYGIDSVWIRQAAPWMIFPAKESRVATFQAKQKVRTKEDINTADTLQLQDVYGIGPTLARRITYFRDRLGGFVSMDQLQEVYGLDSMVVGRLKRQFEVRPGFEPQRINLREAAWEDLIRHPYISKRQAQAIVAFRAQHVLETLEQLHTLPQVDEKWFARIRPYVRMAPLPP